MKKILFFLLVLLIFGCSNERITDKRKMKRYYCSLNDVIHGKNSNWMFHVAGVNSGILHFYDDSTNRISIEFAKDFKVYFPYEIKDNYLDVRWKAKVESKEKYKLSEMLIKSNERYKDQIFMKLFLLNDTTVMAIYKNENLRNKLNSNDKYRILFPDKYYFTDLKDKKQFNDSLEVILKK